MMPTGRTSDDTRIESLRIGPGVEIIRGEAELAAEEAEGATGHVPASTLYYKAGYPRLQRIKAQWDPRNVFRHSLSIRVDDDPRRPE
jgi:FAD/FMN-containing dehydrogenase